MPESLEPEKNRGGEHLFEEIKNAEGIARIVAILGTENELVADNGKAWPTKEIIENITALAERINGMIESGQGTYDMNIRVLSADKLKAITRSYGLRDRVKELLQEALSSKTKIYL